MEQYRSMDQGFGTHDLGFLPQYPSSNDHQKLFKVEREGWGVELRCQHFQNWLISTFTWRVTKNCEPATFWGLLYLWNGFKWMTKLCTGLFVSVAKFKGVVQLLAMLKVTKSWEWALRECGATCKYFLDRGGSWSSLKKANILWISTLIWETMH